MDTRTFRMASSDGEHRLNVQEWLPEGAPRGVLQLVHGINEYIGRYDRFARWMAAQGFYVIGHDHLGHGKTAEQSADLGFTAPRDGWKRMTEDVRRVRIYAGAQYPNLPYVLLGHSMGSFLVRTYLIAYPGTVDACLLSGTGQNPEPVLTAALAVCKAERLHLGERGRSPTLLKLAFGSFNSSFQPVRTKDDWISRDTAVVDEYCADPLAQFTPTVTLFEDMFRGLRFLGRQENLLNMDRETPIYFFSGGDDPVGEHGKGVRRVYRMFCLAGCRHVWLTLYPGGRHEMLNEINYPQVYQDILVWLEEVLPLTAQPEWTETPQE